MTYDEALGIALEFWKGLGIDRPDPSVMNVMADAIVRMDQMGVWCKEPYIAMLYEAFFAGYRAGRDGRGLS